MGEGTMGQVSCSTFFLDDKYKACPRVDFVEVSQHYRVWPRLTFLPPMERSTPRKFEINRVVARMLRNFAAALYMLVDKSMQRTRQERIA